MTSIRKSRLAVGLSLAALGMLALVALVFGLGVGTSQHARAAVVSGLDFSIGVGSQCDSNGTPTDTCSFPVSTSFTVDFKANALGSTPGYGGYDVDIKYSGNVTYNTGSLVQQGAGVFPTCDFPTGEASFTPGNNSTACGEGPSHPNNTSYTGVMAKMGFACGASNGSGTVTLVHGDGITDLVDVATFASSSEADPPAVETLTINCGAGGGPTNTPTGPTNTPIPCPTGGCPTPTPTRTPVPATPPGTPAAKACGDVNDDGRINPVDALLILQLGAGLISSLTNPASADVNHNGTINAIDATLILQETAGLIPASALHCS